MGSEKDDIPQIPAYKEGVMPKFPFSMMISGSSGSGKTNLMTNIMTNKNLYGGYFQQIIVFSPTAGSTDDTYKKIGLPASSFVREMSPQIIQNIIDNRRREIEKYGIAEIAKNKRVCIILDDMIANRSFLESPEALMMFSLLRHFLCSIIVMMQSYNKLPRALRINANAIMVFPSLQSEVDVLKDEITPAGISKKDFENVITHATSGDGYDFLYINRHAKPGMRVRRNLDEVIDLDKFKSAISISATRQAVARRENVTTDRRSHTGPRASPREEQTARRS
jgi:hypothetical protein